MTKATPPKQWLKKNKLKKGIHALVWASGAAILPAYPEFFSLSIFSCISAKLRDSFRSLEPTTLGRRAQSMSILPHNRQDDDEFAAFEKECAEIEAHRHGLILSIEQQPVSTQTVSPPEKELVGNHYKELINRGSKRPARRVLSAPCLTKSIPLDVLEEIDNWEDDFTLNEWVVPSVKEKANPKPREQLVETWDDDFDQDDTLEVPLYVQNLQLKNKADILLMKKFALHIQDLSLIHENALKLKQALESEYGVELSCLTKEFQTELDQMVTLMHLATFQDESTSHLSEKDIEILKDLLKDLPGGQVAQMLDEKSIVFDNVIVAYLLNCVAILKQSLLAFVDQMKQLTVK